MASHQTEQERSVAPVAGMFSPRPPVSADRAEVAGGIAASQVAALVMEIASEVAGHHVDQQDST